MQTTESRTYGNTNWIDQLTNINGTAITYDNLGNPLKWHNASAITWNGRRMKTFTKTDGTAISYTYNGDGIRTSKTVGSEKVEYLLDGTNIIREIRDAYTLTFLYDAGTLVGFNYDNGSTNANYYYGIDNFGNINYIYDSTGAVVVTYRYDAWGKPISTTGTAASTVGAANPYRYKSYYYDTETGLYYLQSRYYDAGVGRFVNADDVNYLGVNGDICSYNMYVYCENDSVNKEDELGLAPFLGWGVQIEGSFMGLSIGVELIWYKSIAKSFYNARNLPCVYVYGSFSLSFVGDNVWNIKSLIKFVKDDALKAFGSGKKAFLKLGISVSVCAFRVYGTITHPNEYTGPFYTTGGTLYHVKAYRSTFPSGNVVCWGLGLSTSKFGFTPMSYSGYLLIPANIVISISDWFNSLFGMVKKKANQA